MLRLSSMIFAVSAALAVSDELCQARRLAEPAATASVETSLRTDAGQIRQFAFDGNPDTYFASADNAGSSDHFTLQFDKPVAAKSVVITTGRPKGGDRFNAGAVEVSADGKSFAARAKFADGVARADLNGEKIRAVRIKPTEDLKHPLVIREIALSTEPAVATFKFPVEVTFNVDDAPEMKEWAEKAARICERAYPMICEELRSDGFKPATAISMTLKNDYKGVAATGGDRITGSVKYFKSHPDDFGAMVHETVHVVQHYRTRGNPGWLVEGIADYVRFFKYEPGKLRRLNPDRVRCTDSYQVTAAFLGFVSAQYDKEFVRKLNQRMREGEYREEVWKDLTKKTLMELETEWKEALRK